MTNRALRGPFLWANPTYSFATNFSAIDFTLRPDAAPATATPSVVCSVPVAVADGTTAHTIAPGVTVQ